MDSIKFYRLLFTVAVFTFAVLILASSQAHSQASNVIQPKNTITLGNGWATNTINTVIFRHHGVITSKNFQFSSFYDSEGNIKLVQRNLDNNKIMTQLIPGEYNFSDAHNSISMGIDRLGHLHMGYDHHGDDLRYRRSLKPLSIDSWTNVVQMTGRRESRITGKHRGQVFILDKQHGKGL